MGLFIQRSSGLRAGTALHAWLAGLALFSASVHAGDAYTFLNIADNTGPLGNSFSNPALNNNGVAVFAASIGGGDIGIFTGDGGPLTTIVLGGDDNFNVSAFTGINDNGTVAYRESEDMSNHEIYTSAGGAATLIVDNSGNPFLVAELPTINANGVVAFYGVQAGGVSGIHLAAGLGNYTAVADTSGSFVSFGGRASINDNDTAAFYASTSTGFGIYTGDGGPLTTIADTSGDFTSVGSVPSVNNSGTVAFFAGNVDVQGIYTGNGGPLTTIADSDGAFAQFSFNDACINNKGDVAFIAQPDDGERGIFTGPDPAADKVIQVGDPLFGSTLTSLSTLIGPRAINDSGDIVFVYFLKSGQTGVAIAQAQGDPPIPGDINGDGMVDVQDLLALLAAWGPCADPCPEDLNGDGVVDVADLLQLLAAWGSG